MKKASAISPANIAFVKHWGIAEDGAALGSSLSMNLVDCFTHTTVEFREDLTKDELWWGDNAGLVKAAREEGRNFSVYNLIQDFRDTHQITAHAKVVSKNNFPSDAGIASSASGFSAIALALLEALDRPHTYEDAVRWTARGGSYSAVRSLANEFGAYENGTVNALKSPLKLHDWVVGVSMQKKEHTSLEGHQKAKSSPLQSARLKRSAENFKACKTALEEGNFSALASIIEEETWMLHAVMLTSQPALIYWEPATLELIQKAIEWRQEIPLAFSVDAGSTVHLISPLEYADALAEKIKNWRKAAFMISAQTGLGAHTIDSHLF